MHGVTLNTSTKGRKNFLKTAQKYKKGEKNKESDFVVAKRFLVRNNVFQKMAVSCKITNGTSQLPIL